MGQPRKRAGSEHVFEHPFMGLRRDRFAPATGGDSKDAFVLELPDWVNVVALDDVGRVLLVRQFRFGTRAVSLEIPGGGVDPGETPLEAARRELAEETGYEAARWTEIGVVEPNPAIQGNLCTTLLAEGLARTGAHDPDEIDEVLFLPWAEMPDAIERGRIRHALVIAAVHFAERHLAGR